MKSSLCVGLFYLLLVSVNLVRAESLNHDKVTLSKGVTVPIAQVTSEFFHVDDKGNLIQIDGAYTGSMRVIVELQEEPLVSLVSSSRQQALLANSSDIHKVNAKISKEATRHKERLSKEQLVTWSKIQSLHPSATLKSKLVRVLNALIIDIDKNALQDIEKMPGIKRVSPKKLVFKLLADSVPLVNAPEVWSLKDGSDKRITGHGIEVAVLDTGIDYKHPAFGGCIGEGCKVVSGFNFHDGTADPMDKHGHGTLVAGIIAAQHDDYSGVAPNVNLHAYKVLSDEGYGFDTSIIEALEYAVDPDDDPTTDDTVDVINMSLGGYGSATDPLSLAANAAVDYGIVVVTAAGNHGNFNAIESESPAAAEKVITVGATTKSDQLAEYSSKGSSRYGAGLKPELSAPGSEIQGPSIEDGIIGDSGTSLASPHVAGAAALLIQKHPNASPDQIKGMLMAGSADLGLLPFEQGAGRLDVKAAIDTSLFTQKGVVDFGALDKNAVQWNMTLPLTIINSSSNQRTVTIESNDTYSTFPSNATLSWPVDELTIPAKDSITVDISLAVSDIASLPTPDNDAYVYVHRLSIVSESHLFHVPVVFENAYEVEMTFDLPVKSFLLLSDAEDWTQFSFAKSNDAQEIFTIKVPPKPLTAMVSYAPTKSEHYPNSGLAPGATIYAEQSKTFDPVTTPSISFSTEDIDTFVGVNGLYDQNGQEIAPENDELTGFKGSVAFKEGALSQTYARGSRLRYMGLSSYSENTLRADVSVWGKLNKQTHSNKAHLYHIFHRHENNNAGLHDATFFLSQLRDIHFRLPDLEGNKNYFLAHNNVGHDDVVPFADFTTYFPIDSQNIVFSVVPDLAINDRFTFDYAVKTDEAYEHTVAMPIINIPADSGPVTSGYNTEQTTSYPNDHVDLNLGGTFWSGRLVSINQEIYIETRVPDFTWSLFHDMRLLGYGPQVILPRFIWSCGTNEADTIEYYPKEFEPLHMPTLSCDSPNLDIRFASWLKGQVYESSFETSIISSDELFTTILERVHVLENGINVVDQTVNRLNARLIISLQEFMSVNAETVTAELRLDDDNTMPLLRDDVDLTEWQAGFTLPMVSGAHDATVIITYGSNNEYKQTLTNLFELGADAGDADVDGDGTPNLNDQDDDNDGHNDTVDAFPYDPQEWLDTDSDGIGNNADNDDDNDGVLDSNDAYPLDASRSALDEIEQSSPAHGGSVFLGWLIILIIVRLTSRAKWQDVQ